MGDKKPDNVVFNEEDQRYDAALKPFPTNLGAPVIEVENLAPWKNSGITKVNAAMSAEYEEIKKKYQALHNRFQYNNLVYSAKFSFQPVVGNTYHLYKDKNQQPFLSILSPNECNFDYLGSFRLGSDSLWDRIEDS